MKRTALVLLALAALSAFAADPATNAPAATPARADVDASVLAKLDRIIVPEFEFENADICDIISRLGDCSREFDDEPEASERGETFERWRFTIPPGVLDALEEACGELKDFFGELGVSWPPGSSMERSGDDGLVVRNTRENLNLIRMIIDALPVTVLQGDPVVLEDAPATNAPAEALERAEVDAAGDCARFLESAFREIDPGTNGAPAAVVLGDLGWSMACESSISSDSGSAVRHCPWLPKAGERIEIPDKTELTLHVGKHQFVRIARLPPDTSLRESLDEKDRAIADGVGGPLLVVERRENYSSFGHAERNVAIRHFILPPGAREGHPFHPPAGAPARFLFADLAPAPAEAESHAEAAEEKQ